jgi:undecaprenyl-diphosphatase
VTILQAIVLGLVQGITEFAPVSSSGHLILVPWMFGWHIVDDPALNKTFDVALHMGTFLGAVIYFRHDLWVYIKAFFASCRARAIRTPDERLAWALVVGTIPGMIAGVALESVIEDKLGQPWLIAVMLAVFGVVLYLVDRVARQDRDLDSIGMRTGLFVGVAQALALQPGVSRSGVTITASRLVGLNREAAARFSFLLALPIIAGAGGVKALDLMQHGFQGYGPQFLAGFLAAAVSGFLVIWFLLRYLRTHDFLIFMIYRLAVAGLVLLLIATGVRSATI